MGGFKKDAAGSEGRDTFAYARVSSSSKVEGGCIQKMHGSSSLFPFSQVENETRLHPLGKIKPDWHLPSYFSIPIFQVFLPELSTCTDVPIQ